MIRKFRPVCHAFSLCAILLTGITPQTFAQAPQAEAPLNPIVAMRRLTEAQYRNSIADIFGGDIQVAGRFEPIVRPQHQLIATGAASTTLSPAGLEQFDAMARNIAAQVFDEAHHATFIPCTPTDAAKPDAACARATLAPIGRYLFRRPLTAAESSRYVHIAEGATLKSGSFNKGLELSLAAMLVAPDFLYVIESADTKAGTLDAPSKAARLSFLLWNTTPNETLLQAAVRGDLEDQAKFEAIARKMVTSPRFEQGVRAFFADMLLFEKFDELAKDPIVFPRFNPDVAKALPEQILRTLTAELVARQGDYRDIFTTRRTFMTRALGAVYQVPVRDSKGWEAYDFPPESDRAGVQSLAGFLALYSHSGRSSPTLRGRAVRELLLAQPVPNPPGNVNFTAVQDIHNKARPTARDRLAVHASDPVCASCHKITDPIGLSLEHFDGIGAFRLTENGAPINTAATIEGMAINGGAGLGKALASNEAATEAVALRAYEYATARPTDDAGAAGDAVVKDFTARQYRIAALFYKVATMPEAYRAPATPNDTPKTALLSTHTKTGALK